MANRSIITNAGYQAITNAIATNTKISPSYFKVSYDTVAPDPLWTDIPNPVLQKNISSWFKVNDNEFRLYCHILSTDVTNNVSLIGIYDINDTLLFVTQLDPTIQINQDIYIENAYILNNFEGVINFSQIPWDEYEQTVLIIDLLNKYGQLINDHTTFEIALQDLNARVIALEALNLSSLLNNHNLDTYAHPPIQNAISKAGIFVRSADFKYVGQFWDENPIFDQTVTEDMLVYKDIDGKYKPAIDDCGIKSKVVGIAKVSLNRVISSGFINIANQPNIASFNIGDTLYLSTTTPGAIENSKLDVQVGIYLGNNIALIGTVGGGRNRGEVTLEDITYILLLNSNPFKYIYYDKFDKPNTITVVNGTANYCYNDHEYTVQTSPTTFETSDIINSTNTLYRFMVHVDSDEVPVVEYSVDSGNTWNTLTSLDKVELYSNGFNTLRLRFTFNNIGSNFRSYGVLYEYSFDSYTTDTRMLETWIAQQDYPQGSIIGLPNGATYTMDGKSLEIYVNRVRLVPGIDYTEISSSQVQFNVDIYTGDIIVFTEKYGYVDTSLDNQNKLNSIVPSWDANNVPNSIRLKDQITGTIYIITVENGNIVLIPQ